MKKQHKSPRQGDLLFVPITEQWQLNYINRLDPKTERSGYRKDGIVLEGEATGHHHRLKDPKSADVFRPAHENGIVRSKGNGQPVEVIHPEHGTVVLEPDVSYQVKRARENDLHGQTRFVVD